MNDIPPDLQTTLTRLAEYTLKTGLPSQVTKDLMEWSGLKVTFDQRGDTKIPKCLVMPKSNNGPERHYLRNDNGEWRRA